MRGLAVVARHAQRLQVGPFKPCATILQRYDVVSNNGHHDAPTVIATAAQRADTMPIPTYDPRTADTAFQLRYSWSGWPSESVFATQPVELIEQTKPLWESDGLRVLESRWTTELAQILFSARPPGRQSGHCRCASQGTARSRAATSRAQLAFQPQSRRSQHWRQHA